MKVPIVGMNCEITPTQSPRATALGRPTDWKNSECTVVDSIASAMR